ncbi:hypothetical protein B0T21DRAFT_399239 [Apiosordaria backusii]|uniref:Uncharacterized protein n=1 Tax=Apiosordaria backusii TaxID=314023 RepID=A0AA40K3V2_9PEZI|nr:hypothetical protein B0T21DRAFT_399239 [Apiosordaria backusii]
MIRFDRADANMPKYCNGILPRVVDDAQWETAAHKLWEPDPTIPNSRLLHTRLPVQRPDAGTEIPKDIAGRLLMVFQNAGGRTNVWKQLPQKGKTSLIHQAARIRASLFDFNAPAEFFSEWFLPRTFTFMPESLSFPVEPTREFWTNVFRVKIEATIRQEGNMIGWESDNHTVGPQALKAKEALLEFIPHILPEDKGKQSEWMWRPVLEHGDYGIHNMSITVDEATGEPSITSIFDMDRGCIVRALLVDPEFAVSGCDFNADENGGGTFSRLEDDDPEFKERNMVYAKQYLEAIYEHAPNFKRAIIAGKDARYLWFALRGWRGDDPEQFFGGLGKWAASRVAEIGVASGHDLGSAKSQENNKEIKAINGEETQLAGCQDTKALNEQEVQEAR